jgi:hypothetical protein
MVKVGASPPTLAEVSRKLAITTPAKARVRAARSPIRVFFMLEELNRSSGPEQAGKLQYLLLQETHPKDSEC